jgi:hypothetical protein
MERLNALLSADGKRHVMEENTFGEQKPVKLQAK